MSNFDTLDETTSRSDNDFVLLRQGSSDYKQRRSVLEEGIRAFASNEANQALADARSYADTQDAATLNSASNADNLTSGTVAIERLPSGTLVTEYSSGIEVTADASTADSLPFGAVSFHTTLVPGAAGTDYGYDGIKLGTETSYKILATSYAAGNNVVALYTRDNNTWTRLIGDNLAAALSDVENATGTDFVSASQIGLRAATFGLDGRNMRLPANTSLNSDFPTGNYDCEEFLDSPIDGWCHLFVLRHSNPGNFQYQEIVKLDSQPVMKYHRIVAYGSYQGAAWQRIYDSHALPTVTQQEAIDPSNTNVYAWTPQRVAQVASNQSGGLGINQRWQLAELSDTGATFDDGTASYRANNVTYTNTTQSPIQVFAISGVTHSRVTIHLTVDDLSLPVVYGDYESNGVLQASVIVPSGSTYRVEASPIVSGWAELR